MKKLFFSLMAIVMLCSLSYCQEKKSELKYFNSKLNFTYKFKDRNELVDLTKRIILESEIANFKNEAIRDFQLEISENELTYTVIATDDAKGPCPDGFTFHGKFTSEEDIAKAVAGIAAPPSNCCPKVTIVLDRVLTGVNICSKKG